MIDCPCGYGKDIPESQDTCSVCGTDVTPLHRLRALPRAYYQHGISMVEQGHLSGAIEQLAAAVALGDSSADIHKALGDVYASRGMNDEAARHYCKGLEIDPEREELKHAQAQLKETHKDLDESSTGGEQQRSGQQRSGFLTKAGVGVLGVVLLIAVVFVWQRLNPSAPVDPNANRAAKAEEIKRRLAAHPLLAPHAVNVAQSNDGLRLWGTVPSELHKALASEVARGVAGEHPNINLDALNTQPAPPESDAKSRDFAYTVRNGDTLNYIAFKFYGDGSKWDKVFDANRNRLNTPHNVSVGQVLSIPSP